MQRATLPHVTGYVGFFNGLHRPLQRVAFSDVSGCLKNRTFFYTDKLAKTCEFWQVFACS